MRKNVISTGNFHSTRICSFYSWREEREAYECHVCNKAFSQACCSTVQFFNISLKLLYCLKADVLSSINLFINSDAILNRDALWSIQGKKHYLQAAIVGGIHQTGKILRLKSFLVTMGICQ